MRVRFAVAAGCLAALGFAASAASLDWPQWGGPNRNFIVDVTGLAGTWLSSGPKQLWKRTLGEGYSTIVTDGVLLYTMYRNGNQEVVVAIDPASGKTKWEYAYDAAILPRMGMENGHGPHSTPLILGDRVYTIGILARMHAFDKKTGKIVWSKDLYKDFPGSTFIGRGFPISPLAYKDTIIVKLGGPGHAVIAISPKDGSLVWQGQDFTNAPSSPAVINVDGQDQLVTTFSDDVVGMDPSNGKLLWRHPHRTQWGLNISTPVWGPGNLLFVSSAYNGGTRVLQLSQSGGKTTVKELWSSNRMRIHFSNAIRIGDFIYGSSGDFGPAPMTAVEVKEGKIAWQDRTFAKASMVLADGKVILLDEDGTLALVTLSPQGMQVLAKTPVLMNNAWTAPTLAGAKLYVRDRHTMMALDLR